MRRTFNLALQDYNEPAESFVVTFYIKDGLYEPEKALRDAVNEFLSSGSEEAQKALKEARGYFHGSFYSMQRDLMDIGKLEASITKAQFNCVSDSRTYAKPFVPIVTESLLIFHKDNALVFDFSCKRAGKFNMSERDCEILTWHHLVRVIIESKGGSASLQELYDVLESHPKSQANKHYKERIRATIYEHKTQYLSCGDGVYKLSYSVA